MASPQADIPPPPSPLEDLLVLAGAGAFPRRVLEGAAGPSGGALLAAITGEAT